MNSRINENQTEINEKRKNFNLNTKYKLKTNFRNSNKINRNNRYSADINKVRTYNYFLNNQINLNSTDVKNPSPTINSLQNKHNFDKNNRKGKYFFLNNNRNKCNTNYKNQTNYLFPFSQINRIKLFKSNSLEYFETLKRNKKQYTSDIIKSDSLNINNTSNPRNLYKRIFPNDSQNNFFKIKNINNIIIKSSMLNKRINPISRYRKIRTLNYCDASTNTNNERKIIENKIIQSAQKPKRPLMMDYFESEHKKFCHGFDKFKGRNKLKIPFFIVYKY